MCLLAEICDEAMKGVISYIYPKLEKEFELAKSAELYEAIKDIEVNDTEPTLQLTEECRNVIKKCHLMKNDINVPNNFLHKLQGNYYNNNMNDITRLLKLMKHFFVYCLRNSEE